MKHFIIALVLITLVFGLVVFNSFYIRNTVGEFYDKLAAMPEDEDKFESYDRQLVLDLVEEWRKLRFFASLSTHLIEIERVDEAITDLCSHMVNGEFCDYYASRERAREAVLDLIESEKFNLKNIF